MRGIATILLPRVMRYSFARCASWALDAQTSRTETDDRYTDGVRSSVLPTANRIWAAAPTCPSCVLPRENTLATDPSNERSVAWGNERASADVPGRGEHVLPQRRRVAGKPVRR